MRMVVLHTLGGILCEIKKMRDSLPIKWYPMIFDFFWEGGINSKVNDLR